MEDKILPCKCGYSGELAGTNNGVWLRLECPKCSHYSEAFTLAGLVETWNEKAVAALSEQPATPSPQ